MFSCSMDGVSKIEIEKSLAKFVPSSDREDVAHMYGLKFLGLFCEVHCLMSTSIIGISACYTVFLLRQKKQ